MKYEEMKTSKNIDKEVANTFDTLDSIEKVKVSPFFKDKTMQRLFEEKEETVTTGFGWFTPKLQLTTLICVLIINVVGLLQLSKTEYNTNISDFAKMYELEEKENTSLFN